MANRKTTDGVSKKTSRPVVTKSLSSENKTDTTTPPAAKSAAASGDAVDEQLARYRSMRDFNITAEPAGKTNKTSPATKPTQYPFVIQKHAATRLHYDFRLGWNGVLKSWAVAKGPSYNVKDKRLAVQVEDHPMEYGGFEGIIPKGQYGGGTVMVWDQGTWEPQLGHEDIDEGLRSGSLKFLMHGTKMQGKWTLIRMGGRAAQESKPNWLLIKEHDDFERSSEDSCITEEKANSAVTGRSLEQIAQAGTHVWNSKETAGTGQAWFRQDKNTAKSSVPEAKSKVIKTTSSLDTASLPKESLPDFIEPQLAQQAEYPPADDSWLHELKLDGYRVQARKDGKNVQLLTRTGLDWTHRMKPVATALAKLSIQRALFDGEVVVLDDEGISSFANLQASFEKGEQHPLTYFIFDLLHADGHDLRALPLEKRKALLAETLADAPDSIRLSQDFDANGEDVFHKACELHAEGIISKRKSAKYISGRNPSWLKSKCVHEQEFVIGGFTLPSNGTHGIGALLLGYYDDAGKLIYAGRTGTGFTQKIHRMLRDRLDALRQTSAAYIKTPAEARRGAIWVRPELVAQVRFSTWTTEDLVRQASYQGLREDKPANEVRREEAAPQPRGSHRTSIEASPTTAPPKTDHKTSAPAKAKPSASAPVRLTHPDKILDTESGLTKQQLADYYWAVADRMLPHIADRPLSLVRCPEGSIQPCFYQKHVNHMLPPGITSVMITDKKSSKPEPYITLNSPEALSGLAQIGVLEVHPWGSHNETLELPDRIIIDLDPDAAITWKQLSSTASQIRDGLKAIGLESFLKTTGGKGLHLVIPIKPENDWNVIKSWAHGFVLALEREDPALFLTKMTKAARKDKIYLDYLRNERGATAVAPFSPRARSGAPVSLPLAWSDLSLKERPSFSVSNFTEWKSRLKRDPWQAMATTEQSLTPELVQAFASSKRSA